jgi:pyruvate carboxylase
MKMETSVRAERDARVLEVLARPGEQVDAKDLLLILE